MKNNTKQFIITATLTLALLLSLSGYLLATPQKASAQTTTYTQISAGNYHTCGIQTNGTVSCAWEGKSQYGQANPPSGTFSQISAGGLHTCGIKTNGTLACWGAGTTNTGVLPQYGQSIAPAGTYTQISAGEYTTCALNSSGAITCWGQDNLGSTIVPSGTYTQVTTGVSHTCKEVAGLRAQATSGNADTRDAAEERPPHY